MSRDAPPVLQNGESSATDFLCLLCGAGCFTASEMESHIQSEHQKKSETAEEPDYSCMFCLYSSVCVNDLQSHISRAHPEQCLCFLCLVTFASRDELNKHEFDFHVRGSSTATASNTRESPTTVLLPTHMSRIDATEIAADLSPVQTKGREIGGDVNIFETSLRLNDCPAHFDMVADVEDGTDGEEMVSEDGVKSATDEESNFQEILSSSLIPAVEHRDTALPSHDNNTATVNRSLEEAWVAIVSEKLVQHKARENLNAHDRVEIPRKEDGDAASVTGLGTDATDEENHFCCPFCFFRTSSAGEIQLHVDREHMLDDGQEGDENEEERVSSGTQRAGLVLQYTCPFCVCGFDTPNDLSGHINRQHPEGEIGGGSSSFSWLPAEDNIRVDAFGPGGRGLEKTPHVCPVCAAVFQDAAVLAAHVDSHFASPTEPKALESLTARDSQIALRLQQEENKSQEADGNRFQQLQAKFGMDSRMTAKQQFERDLEQAVSKGTITTQEFHQKKMFQQQSVRSGVDDETTQVPGILENLRSFYDSRACPRHVSRVYLSNSTHHYSGSFGDKGWGCGYRNLQMLLSCLRNDPIYFQVLFNGQAKMPSILKLQQLLEMAWQKGFDPQGSEQLGRIIVNTRKWIGATEIVAILSSLRIKCMLLDFTEPSGPNNTHPVLLEWVREYFTSSKSFKPPLYLQHQGHSRTIVGVEQLLNGDTNLLLFDPGVAKDRMLQFRGHIQYKLLQTVRRTIHAFRAKQFQIVAVVGVLNDKEYEASKLIRSTKIS